MSPTIRHKLQQQKRGIDQRIKPQPGVERPTPIMAANIHYDLADQTRAIAAGGIGAIYLMARKIDAKIVEWSDRYRRTPATA